ncbi:hypothetical protein PPSIR1_38746 [Plesiocystis pacifica SIR-1]|uniref:Uncharacterized protein n=1 Tax=Plesiocystis pacifica SIR-1 TaxID=391625 RepID=A6G8S2_9BACT|nr:hypothetical protein PPSIR1_38746 [Plesiocystis pacifica SIR-1]
MSAAFDAMGEGFFMASRRGSPPRWDRVGGWMYGGVCARAQLLEGGTGV